MYVCGITAYDECHLGHARAAISFDVIYKYLKYSGYDVTYVRNFTDVDDKIINKSNQEKKSCEEISAKYIDCYLKDMNCLNVAEPEIQPKATEHIQDMINTIQKLINNGLAYESKGNVYFSVRAFPGYGKLSGKNIEDLESGARVEPGEEKNDPLDFALWKTSKPEEPAWDSPWGKGRPGWHIECSAMSSKYLGQPFDIHGGGIDLVFPHHENEIAQAEGAEKKQFVKYWMHNGHINIDSEKMSKSLGNFKTIKEVVSKIDPEAIRFFIVSNHYRSPIDYTMDTMAQSKETLERFYEMSNRLNQVVGKDKFNANDLKGDAKLVFDKITTVEDRFKEAMDDDFNTALAVSLLLELVRPINKLLDSKAENVGLLLWAKEEWSKNCETLAGVLGVFGSDPGNYLERNHSRQISKTGVDAAEIEKLLEERRQARKSKDFASADAVRNKLADMGIEIKDKPDGTTEWKMK